jgi:hypothetical protein
MYPPFDYCTKQNIPRQPITMVKAPFSVFQGSLRRLALSYWTSPLSVAIASGQDRRDIVWNEACPWGVNR